MEPEEQTQGDEERATPEKTSGVDESAPPARDDSSFRYDEDDESQYFERLFAFKKAQDEEKQETVRVALGKFNAFLHLTAYVAGIAYLLLLGTLYRPALPWVLIPIILWTIGISYHFYRAFRLKGQNIAPPGSEPTGAGVSADDLEDDEDGEGSQQ
jgi:hypothetical protein